MITGELKNKCTIGFGIMTDLVYDSQTKIVYYKDQKVSFLSMCPYISENGKYCRFIDGKIVEVG